MGVGEGGGWVDELQNKAEAQPAWLQRAARAAAGALLSLAIKAVLSSTGLELELSLAKIWNLGCGSKLSFCK